MAVANFKFACGLFFIKGPEGYKSSYLFAIHFVIFENLFLLKEGYLKQKNHLFPGGLGESKSKKKILAGRRVDDALVMMSDEL